MVNVAKKALAIFSLATISSGAFMMSAQALSPGNPYKAPTSVTSKIDGLVAKIQKQISPLSQDKKVAFLVAFEKKVATLRTKYAKKADVVKLLDAISYEVAVLKNDMVETKPEDLLSELSSSVETGNFDSGTSVSVGGNATSNETSASCEKKATSAQEFASRANSVYGQGNSDLANYPANYLKGIPANEHAISSGFAEMYRQMVLGAWAYDIVYSKNAGADWNALFYAVPAGTNAEDAKIVDEVFRPLFQSGFNTSGTGDKLKTGYDWMDAYKKFVTDPRVSAIIKKQAAKQVDSATSESAKKFYSERWRAVDCFVGKGISGL